MKMNLEQTQLVGLTMKLDLKAREYKKLCEKLEEYKTQKLDPNSEEYENLLKDFQENQREILKINYQLEKLNKQEENK